MKTMVKYAIWLMLIGILASCSSQSTPTLQSTPTVAAPVAESTTYPIASHSSETSAYPLPGQLTTQTPLYLVPGFITNTPDANLTSIIVSEVRHENDVESIYLTNISAIDQDISNFMVYSPALDVRKILPSNLVLKPGESFILYNGANLSNLPADQQWLDTPILTQALDEVWLTNSAARILYYFIYYPSITP